MPYTPEQLRAKIREKNQGIVAKLTNEIDEAMLKWDGVREIGICPPAGFNDLILQEIKIQYSSWDVKWNDNQRDGSYLTFTEKKRTTRPPDNLLEFGGQSRPWDRYDYPG